MTNAEHILKTVPELREAGLISENETLALREVAARYAIAITPDVARLIDETDPADPIARQFVPTLAELDHRPEESKDPIGDRTKSPVRGIVHRYRDRVLLKAVAVCPVYCRFCFRREMVGPENEASLTESELDAAISYIAEHPQIWEVVITGGDPLILSPRRVTELSARLSDIPHVRVIRWHTRVPVVSPDTVSQELTEALASARPAVFVAVHANHARELTEKARAACRRLTRAGVSLVSQTVLLKGVNDDADALEDLMRSFVEAGVKPYYLHHPDLAPGTGHFRVPIETGQLLMRQLRQRVSGLAMPTYVLDIPGAFGKVPAGPQYLRRENGEESPYVVTDPNGGTHSYTDSC